MPANLLRVTQMNAVYLDTEIVKCMQEALRDSLKYLPVSAQFSEVMLSLFENYFLSWV